jgi:hypothetical protein
MAYSLSGLLFEVHAQLCRYRNEFKDVALICWYVVILTLIEYFMLVH